MKTKTYKLNNELEIAKSMKQFAKETKSWSGLNVHKTINYGSQQVLVYSGSHDGEIGIMEFVFASTAANRKSFELGYSKDMLNYISIQIDNPAVAEHKSFFGDKKSASVDFRKINSFKTAADLIEYLLTLDYFDYGYADKAWSGFDFDFTITIKK